MAERSDAHHSTHRTQLINDYGRTVSGSVRSAITAPSICQTRGDVLGKRAPGRAVCSDDSVKEGRAKQRRRFPSSAAVPTNLCRAEAASSRLKLDHGARRLAKNARKKASQCGSKHRLQAAEFGLKRLLYSTGAMPSWRRKSRHKVASSPTPVLAAMVLSGNEVCSSMR